MATDTILRPSTQPELLRALRENKGLSLLVFSAEWCGPCKLVAQWLDEVQVLFKDSMRIILIKQEKIQEAFISYEVNSMPTFVLLRGSTELKRMTGNNKQGVIDMVQSSLADTTDTISQPKVGDSSKDSIANGKFINLQCELDKTRSHCLNVANDKDWLRVVLSGEHTANDSEAFFIQSDVDAQLIITLEFLNPVHVYGFYVLGPEENGPKDVRVFANENRQLDFSYCEQSKALQKLTKRSINGGVLKSSLNSALHKLKPGSFKSFFVNSNQSDDPDKSTVITSLRVYGCPVDFSGVSLKNFKRVAGSPNTPHE